MDWWKRIEIEETVAGIVTLIVLIACVALWLDDAMNFISPTLLQFLQGIFAGVRLAGYGLVVLLGLALTYFIAFWITRMLLKLYFRFRPPIQ